MAKFEKGILGGFSGKIGPVIGLNWRGKDVMRSRPRKSNRPATDAQTEQRTKFAMAIKLLSPLKSLFNKYFGQPEEDRSRQNLAISYHITEAISGTYPALEFDYQKILITKGVLLGPENLEVTLLADSKISIEWSDDSNQGLSEPADKLLVSIYNETRGVWQQKHTALRSDTSFELDLPDNWTGNTVHCWISFTSDIRKLCATSQYAGPFVLL